nr:cytochrome P450 CYP82D47-like [Ipomoea trifida]
MLAGKRYFGTAAVSDEEDGRRCQRVLRDFVKFVGVFVPADALPFLGWFDIGGYEKSMKEVAKEIDSLMDEWIQEHRLKKEGTASEGSNGIGTEKDFIDGMLSRIEGIDLNGCDIDTVIKSTCLVCMRS